MTVTLSLTLNITPLVTTSVSLIVTLTVTLTVTPLLLKEFEKSIKYEKSNQIQELQNGFHRKAPN